MRMPGFRKVFAPHRHRRRAVDEELRSHLEMKAADLERDGMSSGDAEREARRSFGDWRTIRDECRRIQVQAEGRRGRRDLLDGLRRDLSFALRTLARNPGFSVVAVVTLALGIGANTAVFSIVNGLMLSTLPAIEEPGRLVEITQGDGDDFASLSYPVFRHVRDNARLLDDLAAFDVVSLAMGGEGTPEVYFGLQVTGNYFSVLGVRPALGRFFAPRRSFFPEVEDAVVIGYGLWQRRFAGSADVLGRSVLLNGYPVQIIGVAPPGFGGHLVAAKPDLFVPIGMPAPEMHSAEALASSGSGALETIGRLAPGSSLQAAAAEVAALATAFIRAEAGPQASYPLQSVPYGAIPGSIRSGAAAFLAVLMSVVGLLLLITCVNVANMTLSRGTARRKEIAVRLAMGASRTRLMRQLLTESLLIAALAAAAGTALGLWLTRLASAFEPPIAPFPGMRLEVDFGFDVRVLVFAVVVTCMTTMLFGLVPALRATRPDPISGLRDGRTVGRRRFHLRAALVAAQMATTIVLLLGTGLFLRAFRSAQAVDTGFRVDDVYVAGFDVELNGYDDVRTELFYAQLIERASDIPAVTATALAGKLPLAGASTTTVMVSGYDDEGDVPGFNLHNQSVSSEYFRTLDVPLLSGRTFRRADASDAPMVAIVNETMAERFWSLDRAVGESFLIFGDLPVEVVGVVADAKYHGLNEETPIFAYFSHRQRPRTDMYLHLKTEPGIDSAALWAEVRRIAADIDPAVPVLSAGGLEEALRIFLFPQLVAAWITGIVGAIGLLLGAVGIYGVTSYATSRRAHEIGVRMALGASDGDVHRMIVRQGMMAPLSGMAAGLLLAAAMTRLLSAFLFDVSPLDPLTFVTVSLLLGAVAVLATLLPARRAARVDPAVTLKAD